MFIYYKDGPVYRVGHYQPAGNFWQESKHNRFETAVRRVSYLNGGAMSADPHTITDIPGLWEIVFD
jgi:hypothetical protein